MANFSALKTAIQNAIKQNGNEEITGDVLQQILLSIVNTMGDGAINTIEQNLSSETLARQGADNTLQQNIDAEAGARQGADNTLQSNIDAEELVRGNADTQLQNAINAIKADIDNGYVYAGIATPSSTPVSGKVFYIATDAGTYTNFGGQVLTQGINILRFNGSAWSSQQLIGIDDVPTAGSNNFVKSSGVQNELALGAVYDVSAKNPTGGPNNDGKWESLSALLSDANLDTLIPTAYRKGGMSIKYVHTNDNKYMQYFLTKNTWSANVSDWEKVNLKEQISKLERGAKYIGTVDKDTVPSITGINIFAFAYTPGVYTHFDGIELGDGELATLYYSATARTWLKQQLRLDSLILNRFVYCESSSSVSDKTVNLQGFHIYPEGNNPFFLMRMQYRNTADNVTLNVNNTGAKPLLYRGVQMSSTNSPNYDNAYFMVFYFERIGSYIALEIARGTASELGEDNSLAISQAGLKSILASQWLTNSHSETHFYEGYVVAGGTYGGEYHHSDVVIVSQGLTGYVRIKTKSPYCISSGHIYKADGTPNGIFNGIGTISAGNGCSFYLDPTKEFVRLNVRNIDNTLPISPDYDFLDYCYIDIDEKRIVDGHSLLNIAIKELYLNGADANKDYYISSLSKNYSEYYVSSLVVREKVSGDVVARYSETNTPNPPAFIKLVEQNNSGINGLALVDWFLVENGALITNPEQYNVLGSVRNINECPQLSLYLNATSTRLIDSLSLVADDGVIHTAWNYVLKDVTIGGIRYLQFSDDLGETFTQAENTYGDIVYVHFFSNGTCLFATANKCYYFNDITNIQESTLLDENGNVYTSNCVLDFFQNDQSRNDAMLVGGKEIVTWGNYSLGGTRDPNYVARVWYSADYGATVKCAIKFGTTVISGETTSVRHVHGSLYNKYNEKFIIITGDVGNECQIIEGIYNPTTDSWQFTKLEQGDQFKFGDVLFRENFVYLVTDYTLPVADYPRGILRCPYEMLGDYSKYQYICKVENTYTGSLIGTLEDENGNKLLFPDGSGAGKIWYCKHNFKFVQIPVSENVVITNVGSPNYNGEIYARKSHGSASFPFKLSPMVNLTKSMRNSGCSDFFVQDNVLL